MHVYFAIFAQCVFSFTSLCPCHVWCIACIQMSGIGTKAGDNTGGGGWGVGVGGGAADVGRLQTVDMKLATECGLLCC